MLNYKNILMVIVLATTAFSSLAEEQILMQIKQLHAQGQSEQAFQLGEVNLEEWGGLIEFDYYYGMAAVDSGHVSEGIFALERVLYQQPNHRAAKLELARAYYLLKQYPLARQHFQAILAVTPPVSVIERINTFMQLIDKAENELEPHMLAYFEVIGGHDSNANFAPGSANFYSPILGDGELSDDGTAQSAWYNDTRMGVGYYSPLNKLTTIYLRADLSEHNVNPTIEYDSFTYTLQAGAVHKFNADLSLSAQLIHQQHSVDGARYREMDGVAANLVNVLNAKTSVQIGASYLNFTYNDLDNKDAQEYNFSLGYNRQVPLFGTSLIMARLSFGEDKPDEDNNITQSTSEREFWGSSLAHKIPLSNTIVLTSTIAYQHSEYAADDLLFAVTREDETFSFDVTADWRLNKHWRLSVGAGWREQDSNIEIYNFDRMYGQVGIRYEYY